MSDQPELREVYDRVAAELGPRLSDVTASDRFAVAVEVVDALRNRAAAELQRSSRRFLHACNLPAGTDITLLREEIGALDRTVRTLARQVEDLQRQLDESRPAGRQRRRAAG